MNFHETSSQKQVTRRRALTSLPLPELEEEKSCFGLEYDDDNSYHDLPMSSNELFQSPNPSLNIKHKLNTTCATTNLSYNKLIETNCKRKENFEDEVYFENTYNRLKDVHFKGLLDPHEITEKFRGKMLDWMIEVLKIYKQKEETIFRSFQILDSYLFALRRPLKSSELHLIGAVCMFVASKQEEISPITLNVFYNDICKCKFEKDVIINTEIELLTTLNFKTQIPTVFEMIRCGLRIIDVDDREITNFVENISTLISKMCLFSVRIINQYSLIEISVGSLCLSLKLVENLKPYFVSDCYVI